MAAKPTPPTAVWASDTNWTSGPQSGTATKTAPSSGFTTQGCVAENAAPAGFYNYLFNYFDKTCRYVLDQSWVGTFLTTGDIFGQTTTGNLGAYGNIFRYTDTAGVPAPKTRHKHVNLSRPSPSVVGQAWFTGNAGVGGGAFASGGICYTGGAPGVNSYTQIVVELPHGSAVSQLQIAGRADGTAGTYSVALVKSVDDIATGGPAAETVLATTTMSATSSHINTPVLFSPETVNNITTTYFLRVTALGGAPSTGHSLHWADLQFDEVNPSGNGV